MDNEILIRLCIFFFAFAALALLERLIPRRSKENNKGLRWRTNWSFIIIDTFFLRLLAFAIPLLAIGAAADAKASGIGIFNLLEWPVGIEFVLSILILDFAIWVQHLITHKIPFLWRVHQVHHSDPEFDVSTAIRFHPIEIVLSMLFKVGLVYLLGPAVLTVLAFEILLNASAMFNHANIKISPKLERMLRFLIVTPDMHRIHHSIDRKEHDSNYGFALSIWDNIFGTYKAEPYRGHQEMEVGLEWQNDKPTKFWWSLWLPFINR